MSLLFLQANRARTALIQQIDAFFAGNGLDAFIGPSTDETSMGNVVGLPQMVIPVDFEPVSVGSARQQPITVGIYALPNQDSKVRPCLLVCLCLSASLLCQVCGVSRLTLLLLRLLRLFCLYASYNLLGWPILNPRRRKGISC